MAQVGDSKFALPASELVQVPLGVRGYHATMKADGLDLRLYQRPFSDATNKLIVETIKGVKLSRTEWSDLAAHADAINEAIRKYHMEKIEPKLMLPLATRGLHVAVNIYQEMLFIHIRVYSRAYYDPGKLFPTKKGVALKYDEWDVLNSNMDKFTDMFMT